MNKFNSKNYPIYANFLNKLAKDLTSFYYSKLNKTFKISNKSKGKGYDPVTTSDKAFEKFTLLLIFNFVFLLFSKTYAEFLFKFK